MGLVTNNCDPELVAALNPEPEDEKSLAESIIVSLFSIVLACALCCGFICTTLGKEFSYALCSGCLYACFSIFVPRGGVMATPKTDDNNDGNVSIRVDSAADSGVADVDSLGSFEDAKKERRGLDKEAFAMCAFFEKLVRTDQSLMTVERESVFKEMAPFLQGSASVGSIDRKWSGEDCTIAVSLSGPIAAEERQQKVRSIAIRYEKKAEQCWRRGASGVLDEICMNLVAAPPDLSLASGSGSPSSRRSLSSPSKLDDMLIVKLCLELRKRHPGFLVEDQRLQVAPLGLLVLSLYTMQDVDIDRALLFPDCPPLPESVETRQGISEAYETYRMKRRRKGKSRNPDVCLQACGDSRRKWDAFVREVEGALLPEDELEVTRGDRWFKWVCLLGALRQKLPKLTVYTFLTKVPRGILQNTLRKQPGDLLFWPTASSATLDTKFADAYAKQQLPVEQNVIFEIDGVTEGILLEELSPYPREQEVMLPPFTLLQVTAVHRPSAGQPARIFCNFESCLMGTTLQAHCEQDLVESMVRLWRATENVIAEATAAAESKRGRRKSRKRDREMSTPDDASLLAGWSEHVDPSSGDKYYFNKQTGTTTWDKPVECVT